jgi:hypothetical protein
MMAEKARFFGDEDSRARILQAASPKEMKALGRGIRGFDEARWRGVRERVVLKGSLLKFGQNPALLSFLLSTVGVLVEASPYDNIWGIGETLYTRTLCRRVRACDAFPLAGLLESDPLAAQPDTWAGDNLLGFILTQARDMLQEQAAAAPP